MEKTKDQYLRKVKNICHVCGGEVIQNQKRDNALCFQCRQIKNRQYATNNYDRRFTNNKAKLK